MKKFSFLVTHGLKKRVARKAFIISNIIIAILLIAVVNLPRIISFFTSDKIDDEPKIEVINLYVIDELTQSQTVKITDELDAKLNPDQANKVFNITEISKDDITIDNFWNDDTKHILIHFTGTINEPVINMYNKYESLNTILEREIEIILISYKLNDYQRPIFNYGEAPSTGDEGGTNPAFLNSMSTFLVLPLFILIVFAIQFVGVDIIEEKSTKAIEIIISSVPARMHFFSKIVASILFIIIQGGLLIAYGLLSGLVGRAFPAEAIGEETPSLLQVLAEMIPNWPLALLFAILFVIVGTLLYLVLASLFASMATTQEDYQQFQTPVMLVLLAGFYIGLFAPMFNATSFLKLMSFIPLFSPIVAPIAFTVGSLTIIETVISLVILIAFLVIITYIITPVYRVAILSFEQTKLLTRIKSYFKKGFAKTK